MQFEHKKEINYIKWYFAEDRFSTLWSRQTWRSSFSNLPKIAARNFLFMHVEWTVFTWVKQWHVVHCQIFLTGFLSGRKKKLIHRSLLSKMFFEKKSLLGEYIRATVSIRCEFSRNLNNVLRYGKLSEKVLLSRLYHLNLPIGCESGHSRFLHWTIKNIRLWSQRNQYLFSSWLRLWTILRRQIMFFMYLFLCFLLVFI